MCAFFLKGFQIFRCCSSQKVRIPFTKKTWKGFILREPDGSTWLHGVDSPHQQIFADVGWYNGYPRENEHGKLEKLAFLIGDISSNGKSTKSRCDFPACHVTFFSGRSQKKRKEDVPHLSRPVVVSNILYFHPEPWGRWTHFDEHFFQMGWKPATFFNAICLFLHVDLFPGSLNRTHWSVRIKPMPMIW